MISALHESHKYFSLWLNWSTPNRAANTGFGSHLGGEYKPLLNSALLLLCHYAAMDHKPSISACFGQKSLSLANWHWVVASGCHAWLSWTKGSHTILHQPVNMLRLCKIILILGALSEQPLVLSWILFPVSRQEVTGEETAGPQIRKLNLSTIQPTITCKSLILTVSDRTGLTFCH